MNRQLEEDRKKLKILERQYYDSHPADPVLGHRLGNVLRRASIERQIQDLKNRINNNNNKIKQLNKTYPGNN